MTKRLIFALREVASRVFGHSRINPIHAQESAESWSGRATLAILLGIFIEIVVLFAFPDDKSRWEVRLSVFADVLIGLGLIAEYVCIRVTIVASAVIKAESDDKLGQALERAADAEKAAAQAAADAARANERAAELNLALQREIAARQPRRITAEQRAAITAYLKTAPKGPVNVAAKQYDEEAERFAEEVLGTLKEAGYEVAKVSGPMTFGASGQWITLRRLADFADRPSYVGSIQHAFKEVLGIEFMGQQMAPSYPENIGDVVVAIGAKS